MGEAAKLAAMSSATFRIATPDDAAALAAFGDRMFRQTFTGRHPPDDIDAHCRATFSVDHQFRELVCADCQTLLAVVAGELVGYSHLRGGTPHRLVTGPAAHEIVRFYVDASWHGRGLAHALMAHTVDVAAGHGAHTLYLSVWERNVRAITFYDKHGFSRAGSYPFWIGSFEVVAVLMARPVSMRAGKTTRLSHPA